MTANVGNVAQLRAIITSHTMHVQDHVLHIARRYNNFEIPIHLMTVGLLNTISVYKMSRPTDFQNL